MRLLEIASAEEQIALWRLVSDNIWAALQLQQDQQQRAAVDTAARASATTAKAAQTTPDKTKTKSKKGRGSKNKAMKSVLRSYGRVPKLPRVPVPSTPTKPDAKPATPTDKPGPQTPAPGISAQGPTMVRMSAKTGAAANDQAPVGGQPVTAAQTPAFRHQPSTTRPVEPCQNFLSRPYQPRSLQWDQCWEHPTFHRDRPPKRHRIPRNRRHIVGFLPKRVVHYAEVGQTNDRYS